jgi:hypothetical protein
MKAPLRITLLMRNGARTVIHGDQVTAIHGKGGALTNLEVSNTRDFPLYVRLDSVDAITVKKRNRFGFWRPVPADREP